MSTKTTLLATVLLATLCLPVLADAAVEETKKEGLGEFLNNGVGLGLVTAAVLLAALPFATYARARFPLVLRAAESAEARPYVTVILGAADILLVLLVGAASKAVPAMGVIALILLVALFVFGVFGLGGVAASLGRRLFRDEARGESVGAFVLAWLLIAGLALLPWIGFFYLLWLAARGIGAGILSVVPRSSEVEDPTG